MKIVSDPNLLECGNRPIAAAIGFFDGVHLGHQAVIGKAIDTARLLKGMALVITFDRHPQNIVAPRRAPRLVQPLPQRLATIESLGPDVMLLYHFDRRFSQQSAEAFIRSLRSALPRMNSLSVGANFTFGHRRSGNLEVLRQFGNDLGFAVHGAEPVTLDGAPISSSRIREAIRRGALREAGLMLGRAYSIAGKVVKGDGLGRQLGFATANLEVAGLVLPPNGVYTAHVRLASDRLPAVLNLGVRPTIPAARPTPRLEVHLLDWSGDLYGQDIEVFFDVKLRDEQKFESPKALKSQIAKDVAAARRQLSK